jgi:hypothetical protein
MADANNTLSQEHVVSRRSAIKGIAGGTAAGVLAVAVLPAIAADNDTRLIALEAELLATSEAWRAANRRHDDLWGSLPEDPEYIAVEAEMDRLYAREMELERQIVATPATAVSGLIVKARLICRWSDGETSQSLLADLERMEEGAS